MSDEEWGDPDDPSAGTVSDRLAKLRMSNLVRQYLQAQNLEVLVEGGMEDAVMRFVDKDDRDAIKESVTFSFNATSSPRQLCLRDAQNGRAGYADARGQ